MTNIKNSTEDFMDLSNESLNNDLKLFQEFRSKEEERNLISNFELIDDFLFMRFEKSSFGEYVPILSDHVEETIGLIDNNLYIIEKTVDDNYRIKHYLDFGFFKYQLTQIVKKQQEQERGIFCLTLSNSLHKYEFLNQSLQVVQQWEQRMVKYIIQSEINNKYTIGKLLGEGSQGKVYLANLKELNYLNSSLQQVAIKVVNKEYSIKLQRESNELINEIKMHQQLSKCENIVQLLEIYQDNENVYIVLEYLARGTLTERFSESNSFSEEQVKFIMEQMLLATDFMHSKNIIHRDIKLDNILVGVIEEDFVEVKLADFGLAEKLRDNTLAYKICGTPGCMGPEVFNSKGYSFSADMFSLGALFFNLLTSRYLFSGKGSSDIARRNRICDLSHTTKYLSEVSSDAKEVLHLLLQKDPSLRPSIKQILEHRWFRRDHSVIKSLLNSCKQLNSFAQKNGSLHSKKSVPNHNNVLCVPTKFKRMKDQATSLSLGYNNDKNQPNDSDNRKSINFFKEIRQSRSNSSNKESQLGLQNNEQILQSQPLNLNISKSKFTANKFTEKSNKTKKAFESVIYNEDSANEFRDMYDQKLLDHDHGDNIYDLNDSFCDIAEDCDLNKDDQHNKLSTARLYQLSNKMENLNIVQIRRVFI